MRIFTKKKIIITVLLFIGAVILFIIISPKNNVISFISKNAPFIIELDISSNDIETKYSFLKSIFPKIKGCLQLKLETDNKEPDINIFIDLGSASYLLRTVNLFLENDKITKLNFFVKDNKKYFIKFYNNILIISSRTKLIFEAIENLKKDSILNNKDYIKLKKNSENTGIFLYSSIVPSTSLLSSIPIPVSNFSSVFAADIKINKNSFEARFFKEGNLKDSELFSSLSSIITSFTFLSAKSINKNDLNIKTVSTPIKDIEFTFCITDQSIHISSNKKTLLKFVFSTNKYIYPLYFYGDHIFSNYLIYSLCKLNSYDPKPFLDKIDSIRGELFSKNNFFNLRIHIYPSKQIN